MLLYNLAQYTTLIMRLRLLFLGIWLTKSRVTSQHILSYWFI